MSLTNVSKSLVFLVQPRWWLLDFNSISTQPNDSSNNRVRNTHPHKLVFATPIWSTSNPASANWSAIMGHVNITAPPIIASNVEFHPQ
ncbi:hypothetical protein HanRHA438_Chr07g0323561 [Helianthus annuus]|nr:hypothetical protein HanRHA438_Chr07g0323561 [Helianthus annuus]